ncbi:MAG: PAS domain S-box protein, partial [Synergistota bacterium]|nr:PAS domain S-box protein [Synergistota bacterium]
AVIIEGVDGRVQKANRVFCDMFGYDYKEIIGRNLNELIDPRSEDALSPAEGLAWVLSGETVEAETLRRKKNGEVIRVHLLGVPVRHEGKVVAVFGFYRNIEDRKKAEDAMRRGKAHLEKLIEASPDGILLADNENRIVMTNGAFGKLFGYEKEEVIGGNVSEIVSRGEIKKDVLSNFDRIVNKGEAVDVQTRRTRKDGTPVDVWARGVPINLENGETAFFAIYRDISFIKETEREIRKERNYFENLFEKTPLGIALVQKNSTIMKVNAAFEKLFGYDGDECTGKNLDELLSPGSTLEDARKLTEKAAVTPVILERKHRRKDGRFIDCAIRGLPFKVSDEEPAVFAMYEDITERARVREALRVSEKRYQQLFDESPVAISEQDVSECRMFLEELRESGVTDLREHFDNCEEDYRKAIGHIRLVSANRAMTRLYEAKDPADLKGSLDRFLEDELPGHIIPVLEAVAGEGGSVSAEVVSYTLKGQKIDVSLQIVIPAFIPGRPYRMIVSVEDITERRRTVERIRFLGFHDGLTGLYNQAFLEEEMSRLDGSRDLPISLVVMDVNSLKMVNDVFGHTEGDLLLKKVAEVIRSCCRRDDIVARWGGDEFIALLPCTPVETAGGICERIKSRCAESAEFAFPLSLAMGTAVKENITQTLHEVRRKADEEMYLDKLMHGEKIKQALFAGLEKQMRAWPTRKKHIERLHSLAGAFASFVDPWPVYVKRLEKVVEFHDIGFVSIPKGILKKKGPLSTQEWEMVRKHPERGFHIARNLPDIMEVADEILCHHERFDGSGYPRGLVGESIPRLARFFAVIDAFEVMTGSRPYRPLLTIKEALGEITSCAGSQFDPRFAELFVRMMRSDFCPLS